MLYLGIAFGGIIGGCLHLVPSCPVVLVQPPECDAGSGFLHQTTGRCLALKIGKDSSGPCAIVDPDGDFMFGIFRFHGGKTPLGTFEYIGGTGKYAGLTGHATYTAMDLKTVKDSPTAFEGHIEGTYKLGGKAAGAAQ